MGNHLVVRRGGFGRSGENIEKRGEEIWLTRQRLLGIGERERCKECGDVDDLGKRYQIAEGDWRTMK